MPCFIIRLSTDVYVSSQSVVNVDLVELHDSTLIFVLIKVKDV